MSTSNLNSRPSPSSSSASETPLKNAYDALAAFERSTRPGVWPHLDKGQIISDVRSRLARPLRVDQKQQPFCGPASVVFELIRKQPLRYVQVCQRLFEDGVLATTSRQIQTSENLRQASREFDLAQADWMLMAALRESENLIFPVEPNAPTIVRNIAGMTKSWEMKGWVREMLGYANVEYCHAYLLRDIEAMNRASAAIAQGGVALALVTASGMLGQEDLMTRADSKSVKPIALPDHWIVLTSIDDIPPTLSWRGLDYRDSNPLSFEVYTWARSIQVKMGRGAFRRFFWGVVIGKP